MKGLEVFEIYLEPKRNYGLHHQQQHLKSIPMQPPSVVEVESPSTCSPVIRDDLRFSAAVRPTNLLICVMLLSPIQVKAEQ